MNDRPDKSPALFDVTPPATENGILEAATQLQVDKLRADGFLDDRHAGLVALALVTARDIDRSQGRGAPSGRANLYRVLNEIFTSIPQPEPVSQDQLDAAVDAIKQAAEAEDLEGAPADVRA